MDSRIARAGAWLYRRAENVLALMLGVMFVAFIAQIVFRYFLNWPTGWSSELTVVAWLWMVLFGTAFVLRDSEEIRLDFLTVMASPRARRVMSTIAAAAIVVLYALALRPSADYVSFMKVESTSYLKIRIDYLYSIYIVFLVVAIVRFVWGTWQLWRRSEADSPSAAS
jgi:TRAP-type C4-dicarboxylate transport system permease small subunit